MDFSSFGIKPALTMSGLTVLDCSMHLERSFSVDQPSSKNTAILMRLCLQCFSRGFKTFVNIYDAVDRPKGRTVNT